MRVSPDGNTHFARQENGQFFANGNEKKLGGFGSGSGDIKSRMLEKRNTIPKKKVTTEQ